jgi:hypothetical protein
MAGGDFRLQPQLIAAGNAGVAVFSSRMGQRVSTATH